MGNLFSKLFRRGPKIDADKLAKEFWTKKQDDAMSILNEKLEITQEQELQPIEQVNRSNKEIKVQDEEVNEKQKSNPESNLKDVQTPQQQPQQQPKQQELEKKHINQQQESVLHQNEEQFQQDPQINYNKIYKEEEIICYPEIEHKWLMNTFELDKQTNKLLRKIPDGFLTIDYMVDNLLFSMLTSQQETEEFRCLWLIQRFQKMSIVEVQGEHAIAYEGEIQLSKFEKIMDTVINYLIQGVVHPERLKWSNSFENIDNLDDIRNKKADLVFEALFERSFSIFQFGNTWLNNLFQYLETKSHDAHSFMDYMFKRDFRNLRFTLNMEFERPLIALKFLQFVVNYPKLTESLLMDSWAFGKFKSILIGKQFSEKSMVGLILSISGFMVKGRNLVELMINLKISNQQMNNGKRCFLVIDEFITLFKSILRKGPYQELFKYFSKLIELNLNLERLRNEEQYYECSPAGMIFNLQQILLAIINPWINSSEKVTKSVQNIDIDLMASLKSHPLLKPLYQTIPYIAPETTPYVFKQIIESDKLTMIFLLTQRVNHIVATYIDEVYIGEIFHAIDATKQQFGMDSEHYRLFLKLKVDFDASYLDQVSMSNTMQFLRFTSQIAIKLLDNDYSPLYPYGLQPMSFVQDIHTFITIYNENLESLNLEQEVLSCMEYIILTLNQRNLIANPHLRIRGIELLNLIDKSATIRKSGVKKALSNNSFANNQTIQVNLVPGWLKAYSDSEIAGFGIQFFHKFNVRSKFCKFFRFILEKHFETFKQRIKQTFVTEKEQFLIFLGFHLDDLQFLLDECLHLLEYQENEKELNEQVTFLTEYYDTLQVLSQVAPDAFLIEEMKDKLVNYLNFTLFSFSGPEKIQCKSMKAINFDHRRIIVYVIGIYINLSNNKVFLEQVIKDERFFSISLLQNIINSLDHQILPKPRAQKFIQIIQKLKILSVEQEQLKQIMIDIPEEFIDPLVATIMSDPVKLPGSKMILDRVTIKKQLLNSSQDPFDRTYLTVEMLIEQPELKQKIADYIEGKKAQIQ